MRTVNFRMTDEEHQSLVNAAGGNSRSLQREIHHRVFHLNEFYDLAAVEEPLSRAEASATHVPSFRGPDLKPSQRTKR